MERLWRMSRKKQREKLILSNYQSPGDLLMLSAALRDLHKTYPGRYQTDIKCSCPEIFMNNPYIEHVSVQNARHIKMEYPLYKSMGDSITCCYHFVHAFRKFLEKQLNQSINQTELKGEVYLTDREKNNKPVGGPYWIINTGWKNDYTVKRWSPEYMREVVRVLPDITFVQAGSLKHNHPVINEPNVINMLGTGIRKFFTLVYHSYGIITPVSFPMHACAAVSVPSEAPFITRPCVVLGGGRECDTWEKYNGHTYISRVGMMGCCLKGGCVQARVKPLNDGSDKDKFLCEHPVNLDIPVACCMADILPYEVKTAVERYALCQNLL